MISFPITKNTFFEFFKNACQQEDVATLAWYLFQRNGLLQLARGQKAFYEKAMISLLSFSQKNKNDEAFCYDLFLCLLDIPLVQTIIRDEGFPLLHFHFASMLLHKKEALLAKLLDLGAFKGLAQRHIFALFFNNYFVCLEKFLSNSLYHQDIVRFFEQNETPNFSLFLAFINFNYQNFIHKLIDILASSSVIDIVARLLQSLPDEEAFIKNCILRKNLAISFQAFFFLLRKEATFSPAFILFCLEEYKKRKTLSKEEAFTLVELHVTSKDDNLEILPKLIEVFPEVFTQTNAKGENILLIALLYQKYEMALFLLDKNKQLVETVSKDGLSARALILELQKAYFYVMQNKQTEVTEKWDFEKWVSNLLDFFQLKNIKMMFNGVKPTAIHYVYFFLASRTVQQYLTRSLFSMNEQGELINLSWFEKEFYLISQECGLRIPYRSDPPFGRLEDKTKQQSTRNFFLGATSGDTLHFIFDMLVAKANNRVPYIQYQITTDLSEYHRRLVTLSNVPHDEYGNAFIICFYLNTARTHVQCLLTILNQKDPNRFRHIFINSGEAFSEEALLGLYQNMTNGTKKLTDTCLSVGLHLQNTLQDSNCVLYTKDIAQSLYDLLLENAPLRQHLGNTNTLSYECCDVLLTSLFKKLPQYFIATPQGYVQKDWNSLISYFAIARWRIGCEFLLKHIECATNKMGMVAKLIDSVWHYDAILREPAPVFLPQNTYKKAQAKSAEAVPTIRKKLRASAPALL